MLHYPSVLPTLYYPPCTIHRYYPPCITRPVLPTLYYPPCTTHPVLPTLPYPPCSTHFVVLTPYYLLCTTGSVLPTLPTQRYRLRTTDLVLLIEQYPLRMTDAVLLIQVRRPLRHKLPAAHTPGQRQLHDQAAAMRMAPAMRHILCLERRCGPGAHCHGAKSGAVEERSAADRTFILRHCAARGSELCRQPGRCTLIALRLNHVAP